MVANYVRDHAIYPSYLGMFEESLYVWEGSGDTYWCTDTSGIWFNNSKSGSNGPNHQRSDRLLPEMRQISTIQADLSNIMPSQLYGPRGAYWRVDYKVVVLFEGAKMKAHLEWNKGGLQRQGPARVVPALLH